MAADYRPSSEPGQVLRAFRRRLGLSQFDVAMRASISTRHLSFLETGRARPSAAMVDRLVEALELEPSEREDLREAAGFAPRRPLALADVAFSAALSLEAATSSAEIVQVARGPLAALGMGCFFYATVRPSRRSGPCLHWRDLGAFPKAWLRHYDARHYSENDPLLAAVRRERRGFFWQDVVQRRSLSGPARSMFDDAADRGVHDGFVASQFSGDGLIRMISMMGDGSGAHGPAERLALSLLGRQIIERLTFLERTLPPT
jgi:transcriptional regulator with XRE-family HTH domain